MRRSSWARDCSCRCPEACSAGSTGLWDTGTGGGGAGARAEVRPGRALVPRGGGGAGNGCGGGRRSSVPRSSEVLGGVWVQARRRKRAQCLRSTQRVRSVTARGRGRTRQGAAGAADQRRQGVGGKTVVLGFLCAFGCWPIGCDACCWLGLPRRAYLTPPGLGLGRAVAPQLVRPCPCARLVQRNAMLHSGTGHSGCLALVRGPSKREFYWRSRRTPRAGSSEKQPMAIESIKMEALSIRVSDKRWCCLAGRIKAGRPRVLCVRRSTSSHASWFRIRHHSGAPNPNRHQPCPGTGVIPANTFVFVKYGCSLVPLQCGRRAESQPGRGQRAYRSRGPDSCGRWPIGG